MFDWQQFLNLARELVGQPTPTASGEARKRTAISRAYYSAHHSARQFVEQHPPTAIGPGGMAHGDVWRWFKDQDVQALKEVGLDLDRLYKMRGKADYKAVVPRLDHLVSTSILMAEEVHRSLKGHGNSTETR